MLPAYRDGDWLLVMWLRTQPSEEVFAQSLLGKIVVIEREERPGIFLIKRVRKIHNGMFWVEGDSAESTDSRSWGWVNANEIIGTVLFRYFRKRR